MRYRPVQRLLVASSGLVCVLRVLKQPKRPHNHLRHNLNVSQLSNGQNTMSSLGILAIMVPRLVWRDQHDVSGQPVKTGWPLTFYNRNGFLWVSQDQELTYRVVTGPRRWPGRVGDHCRTPGRDWHDQVDYHLIGLRVGHESGALRCDDLGSCVAQQLEFVEHAGLVHSRPGLLWTRWGLVVDRLGGQVVGSWPRLATVRLYSECLGNSGCRVAVTV